MRVAALVDGATGSTETAAPLKSGQKVNLDVRDGTSVGARITIESAPDGCSLNFTVADAVLFDNWI